MELTIEWTYRTKKGTMATFRSEALPAAHVLQLVDDIEQTGRVQQLVLTDAYDSTWTLKELRRYLKELETEPHNIEVYFDGGFDEGRALAGLGIVIYYEQNGKAWRKRMNMVMEQLTSNNEAEYAALHASVTGLIMMGVQQQRVTFYGDSQVVIQQMSGEWPVYEPTLEQWTQKIDDFLAAQQLEAAYVHIGRKQNTEADRLATQALEGTFIESEKQL